MSRFTKHVLALVCGGTLGVTACSGAKRMYGPPVFDAQTESGTPAPEEQEDVDPSPDETQEPVE
jgi:hypothetical protein